MARLTACFALSAVLLLTGICSGTGQLTCLLNEFLQDFGQRTCRCDASAMSPTRIISKGDETLSIAVNYTAVEVNDAKQVVLAKTNGSDTAQKWYKRYPFADGEWFLLLNRKDDGPQARAMQIPENSSTYEVKLVPFIPSCVNVSMLWRQVGPFGNETFFKIQSVKNLTLYLDGLLFGAPNVTQGTVVGAYPATHDDNNIFWKFLGF